MDWFNKPDESPGGKTAPLQVSELSAIIENLLDDVRLQGVWVKGEVTNYTHHSRGHRYFSLSEKGGGQYCSGHQMCDVALGCTTPHIQSRRGHGSNSLRYR